MFSKKGRKQGVLGGPCLEKNCKINKYINNAFNNMLIGNKCKN